MQLLCVQYSTDIPRKALTKTQADILLLDGILPMMRPDGYATRQGGKEDEMG